MSESEDSEARGKTYLVEEAVKAHKALREAAGLGPEHFPVEAFVGMISDEVQTLRERGWSDNSIAALIAKNSAITITGEEIAENYATEEERHGHEH